MKKEVLQLASLVLDFGKVDRQTFHKDGITHESDTDHTVMLGILGPTIASKLYTDLDCGLIAQFALIHDLVEVHAGDTPTLMDASDGFLKEKEDREKAALDKIKNEFGDIFPWVHETIEKYERLDTKEARFVKVLDKILPKITVVLNGAKGMNDGNLATKEGAQKTFNIQREKIRALAHDMPEIVEMWESFVVEVLPLIKN